MIEPQGPLPPEVYWRRRAVAGAGALAVVVLVILLIVWSVGGGDPESENTAADGTTEVSAQAEAPASEDVPADAGGPGAAGPAGAPAPAEGEAEESDTPADPPPVGPDGQPLCEDRNLSVVLEMDKPTYAVGDTPTFTIVITNGGRTACVRDVGKAAQNVIVKSLDGARTIWAVRDCSPLDDVKNVTLEPGKQVTETIDWSGTTSNPGCDQQRVPVPAGAYQAFAKIGEKESAPITFNVVNAATA